VIERGFAIRLEKAKLLMKNAILNITTQSKKTILMEAIKTAAFLYDECPQKGKFRSPNELWYGSDYKQRLKPEHYAQFGRVGFVTNKRDYVKKNDSGGVMMMMVAYALDSPYGTYRFYNPTTNTVMQSNSVTWKEFFRYEDDFVFCFKDKLINAQAGGKVTFNDTNDDSESEENSTNDFTVNSDDSNYDNENDFTSTNGFKHTPNDSNNDDKRNIRNVTSINDLSTSSKPDNNVPSTSNEAHAKPLPSSRRKTRSMTAASTMATTVATTNEKPTFTVTGNTNPARLDFDTDPSSVNLVNPFLFHTCIQSDPGTPATWRSAVESPEREFWTKSMTAEFNNFISRDAWKFVPLQEVKDKGRKVIPTKLVFKLKDEIDGSIRFKSRCVTLGYMMVQGVDFTERFSPVATDEAFKLQIGITLYNKKKGWTMENCDIEAAFLEPDMENELFTEPHPAMVICGFTTEENRKKMAIKLVKSLYGNVDAAIKFFKILIEVTT